MLARAKWSNQGIWTADKERDLRLCDSLCQFALIFEYLILKIKIFQPKKIFPGENREKNTAETVVWGGGVSHKKLLTS